MKLNLSPFLHTTLKNKKYLKEWDKKYIWHPFTQMQDYEKEKPIIIEEGKGSYIKDTDGKRYLDGVSSLWVNVHGHRKKELDESIRKQLNRVAHSTLLGLGNIPSIELAKKLIEIAPKGLKKVFYSDSGSTAVEIALKMAFQYCQQTGQKKKTKFISFVNAYHGDTVGSVSVGGMDLFHKIYKPLLFNTIKLNAPYCYKCHLGLNYPNCKLKCVNELENTLKKQHREIAGLIIEPLIQGAAGMLTQPQGYIRKVRELCTKYSVLMLADEVATGFGRTGKMFACEHENISPDIMCVAKSITGGYLPLAATLTTQEIYNGFLGDSSEQKTFFHGHTYTGNPLACAVAIASLELYKKEKLISKLHSKISFLRNELKRFNQLEHAGDIRQQGMMVGIELVKDKTTKKEYGWEEKIGIRVVNEARKHGVILRPLGSVIVLMPPLNISTKELKTLLDATFKSIKTTTVNLCNPLEL
ncbi:MAG: adenosylmethionine--8-amino-7-oxononanoate transaminase [Elusimicrobiota bacterium]